MLLSKLHPKEIQLVGDIGQFPPFDLLVSLDAPIMQHFFLKEWVAPQGPGDGVYNVMEEIRLIARVTFRPRVNNPIGTPGRQDAAAATG